MDGKKVFMLCLVLIIAVASLSVIGAADEKRTFSGIDLTIPDGYKLDTIQVNGINKDPDASSSAWYVNSEGDRISINVFPDYGKGLDDDIEPEDVEKTIAGKKGFLSQWKHGIEFKYLDNDHIIFIKAPDEATVEKVIG